MTKKGDKQILKKQPCRNYVHEIRLILFIFQLSPTFITDLELQVFQKVVVKHLNF